MLSMRDQFSKWKRGHEIWGRKKFDKESQQRYIQHWFFNLESGTADWPLGDPPERELIQEMLSEFMAYVRERLP